MIQKVTRRNWWYCNVYFHSKQPVISKSIPALIVIAELTVRCATKTAVRLNLIVSIVELTVIVVYGNATALPAWLPATYKVITAIRCYNFRGERIPRVWASEAAWHSYIRLPLWKRVQGISIYQINFTILPLKHVRPLAYLLSLSVTLGTCICD